MSTVGQLILQRLGVDPIVIERVPIAAFGQDTPPPPEQMIVTADQVDQQSHQKVGAVTVGGSGGTPDNPADLPFPFNLLPKLPSIPGLGGTGYLSPWAQVDWKMALLGLAAIGIGGWVLIKIVGSAVGAAPKILAVAKPAMLA